MRRFIFFLFLGIPHLLSLLFYAARCIFHFHFHFDHYFSNCIAQVRVGEARETGEDGGLGRKSRTSDGVAVSNAKKGKSRCVYEYVMSQNLGVYHGGRSEKKNRTRIDAKKRRFRDSIAHLINWFGSMEQNRNRLIERNLTSRSPSLVIVPLALLSSTRGPE